MEGKGFVDISKMSVDERKALMAALEAEDRQDRLSRRDAYEGLRSSFMNEVKSKVLSLVNEVRGFRDWLSGESDAFVQTMRDYGQLKQDGQKNFTITDGNFRLQISSNQVKGFDERADMAAERLIAYLRNWMQQSDRGEDDPMYQMAMTLLERNQAGDLDYKSISKLYELEDKFDGEYGEIMTLFKESNVVQKTALNYYLWLCDDKTKVWRRIEPSFCRM